MTRVVFTFRQVAGRLPRRSRRSALLGFLALAGCLGSGPGPDPSEPALDPADLFSGQTGSPAAHPECESDDRCREAAEQLAADVDPAMQVRLARCTATGCEALFERADGCSPGVAGPFFDCGLGEAEVRARYAAAKQAECIDGACPPPPDVGGGQGPAAMDGGGAAIACEDAAQCEPLVAGWAAAVGPEIDYRDVMCLDRSCMAVYVRDDRCSPDPHGPWYACDLDYQALLDRYLEDTTPSSPDDSGGVED